MAMDGGRLHVNRLVYYLADRKKNSCPRAPSLVTELPASERGEYWLLFKV